jgi:hypothetical protein
MQNAADGWSLDPGAMRVILLVRAVPVEAQT